MHRVLSCLEKFAPELLLVGVDGDNNIYICMEGMEVTLHQFIYDNRIQDKQGYGGANLAGWSACPRGGLPGSAGRDGDGARGRSVGQGTFLAAHSRGHQMPPRKPWQVSPPQTRNPPSTPPTPIRKGTRPPTQAGKISKSFGRMGKGRFETPRSAWQSSKVCQKPEGSTSVKEQSPVGQNQVLMSKSQALLGKSRAGGTQVPKTENIKFIFPEPSRRGGHF